MKKFYLFFAVVLLFNGCNLNDSDTDTRIYLYTGYDSTGVAIVSGKLIIDFLEKGELEGQWELSRISTNTDNIGPQLGKGRHIGHVENDTAWIALNPDFADNNVGLSGRLDKNEFKGKWTYSSFIGLTNWGTFMAVKR
ncbi:hypothetical protein ACFL4T_05600 [candidate division KSB1 bacterium]